MAIWPEFPFEIHPLNGSLTYTDSSGQRSAANLIAFVTEQVKLVACEESLEALAMKYSSSGPNLKQAGTNLAQPPAGS